MYIVVHKNGFTAFEIVVLGLYIKAFKTFMFEKPFMNDLWLDRPGFSHIFYHCGRIAMIDQRINIRKSMSGNKLFRIKLSVRFPELRMTFVWYLAEMMIVWHGSSGV